MQTSSSSSRPSSGNSNRIVFVAGATGQTGKRIVKELLLQGYEVRAGVRDIAKAKEILPKNKDLDFVSISRSFSCEDRDSPLNDLTTDIFFLNVFRCWQMSLAVRTYLPELSLDHMPSLSLLVFDPRLISQHHGRYYNIQAF